MTTKLEPLPSGFAATRDALHRVAERIVAPARKPDNEISLRSTPTGFGTPVFEHEGAKQQVRVEADELVRTIDTEEKRAPLTSLADAAEIVADLLPAGAELDDDPLEVDRESALVLAGWFALGDAVLERLRSNAVPEDDASPVSLWPEHFDIAIELGSEKDGTRANYGFSPGDADHEQPYLYVGPWDTEVSGDLWNASGFTGAEFDYAELAQSTDPTELALEFIRMRRAAL